MAEETTLRRLPRRVKAARGFTYLSLIIVVAIVAMVTASAIKLGSVLQRSRAEQELLDIGAAFSDALKSYADATPQGMPTQPPSLKDLLKDPRFPGMRRHLRKIFVDPMTGKAEWGIVYLGDKMGVLAVYSLSDARPVKIGNFPARYSGFAGKSRISEWKFAIATEAPRTIENSENQAQVAQSVPALQQNNAQTPQISAAPNSTVAVTADEAEKSTLPAPDEPVSHSEQAPATEPEKPPAEPVLE
ncbi:type II secretion system protein [Pseudoduganella sp. FT55W]|uniref:Type II secretion system protein n=1 Tax=Duganella rivi TaxID=2666083 RepID=A0A7X4GKP7_9BURK|nr:type II secretion system protein [Duganella rivi]MYM65261.1 type II secretion system protein [Duganella rivi]